MTVRDIAATKIQMHCRGYLERRAHEREKTEKALIVIQKAWRTYAARQKVEKHLLPNSLLEKALPFISRLSGLPRAYDGRTPVYYLPGMPVVVKCYASQVKSERIFRQTNNARKVCIEKGFKHICIPRARMHESDLVVKRVFFSSYSKVAISLYIEKYPRFTEAVKEFALFYFETTIPDLVDTARNPNAYKSIVGGPTDFPFGRYDNLAFRLGRDGMGKFALVDMEGFSPDADVSNSFKKCEELICLFPLHSDEVYAVAFKYDPRLSRYFLYFEKQKRNVLRCFEKLCTAHLDFVRRKKIPLYQPARFDKFSDDVMSELPLYLCGQLKRRFARCLKPDSLTRFKEEFFSPLATELHSLIQTFLIDQVKEDAPIRSMHELVNTRTLQFYLPLAVKELYKKLPKLDMFELDFDEEHRFLEHIVHLFFKGLVRYDHIAYANRYLGFKDDIKYCLFC